CRRAPCREACPLPSSRRAAPSTAGGGEPPPRAAPATEHLLGRARTPHLAAAAAARAPAGAGGEPAARRRVPRRSRARHGGGSHLDAPAASRTEGAGVRTNDLSRFLAARGWTDGQLAARTALDRAHVNQLKNGRALPTVATALVIAEALGVTVDAVFPPGSVVRRRRMR
ncbi:MAG: helix-turn-helix transcriptional regulator, partial [Deltaproteobacteria bacterium]